MTQKKGVPNKTRFTNVWQDPLLIQFSKERKLKESTKQGYVSGLGHFLISTKKNNLQEVIDEALEDEHKHIPTKETRLAKHLRQYKIYLNETIPTANTVHTYFTKIETFLRHYDITVPHRPAMKIQKEYHVDYYDLPSKDMIKTAIETAPNKIIKTLIYFMSSSGTAKAECTALTVGRFIDGLRDYTTNTDPRKVYKELRKDGEIRRDLVPVISMTRKKTNVPYYTCCSSETTYHILQYLSQERVYDREEYLWPVTGSYIMKQFQLINDNNNWGFVGPYRRFRTHTLRKFHASNIGCSFDVINMLEGRTNGTIHETYVKQKPDKIKEVYMEHMHNVMLYPELFIGPHCGQQTDEGKIQQAVVDLIPELSGRLENKGIVARPTEDSQTPMQGGMDMNVYKEIGKLEARIELLEERIERLGG